MKSVGPVPFPMKMHQNKMLANGVHAYQFNNDEHYSFGKSQTVTFPSTRAVLWNRSPVEKPLELSFLSIKKVLSIVLNERTLHLAYTQLQVHGDNFNGFFVGQLEYQESGDIVVRIDRFDPGRDAEIKIDTVITKTRVPTTVIPGDLCVPVTLSNGMAFVDHVTTETHTEGEFLKTLKLLQSWCSRKDKLDVKNFLSLKLKCCFQSDGDDVLAFFTCGSVVISDLFEFVPINAIPLIPTALARNLQGPIPLSDVQNHVKTGFVTMDQTRKLLLLLETDPKAYSLPLVGIWISGIENIERRELWASCIRFIYNVEIEERVCAGPSNYLAVVYQSNAVNPSFYEFSRKNNIDNHIQFEFLTSSEGVQINQSSHQDEEIIFPLHRQSTGLMASNFNKAVHRWNINRLALENNDEVIDVSNDFSADDSMPLPSPSPHPQMKQSFHSVPSVPDLSICESSFLSDIPPQFAKKESRSSQQKHSEKHSSPSDQQKLTETFSKINNNHKNTHLQKADVSRFPRHTKASLARMNINKPAKSTSTKVNVKKTTLAINFKKGNKKKQETFGSQKLDENSETVEQVLLNEPTMYLKNDLNESLPRLPVAIRNSHNKMFDLSAANGQAYMPENYSDIDDDHSFVIQNNQSILFTRNVESKNGSNDEWYQNGENRVVSNTDDILVSHEINNTCEGPDPSDKQLQSANLKHDCSKRSDAVVTVETTDQAPSSEVKNTNIQQRENEEIYRDTEVLQNAWQRHELSKQEELHHNEVPSQEKKVHCNGVPSQPKEVLCDEVLSQQNELHHNEVLSQQKDVHGNEELFKQKKIDHNEEMSQQKEVDMERKELYDLVLSQQKQLTALQSQLQVFFNYQEKGKIEDKQNEIIEANEVRSIQEKQQQQLNELQEQVQVFLKSPVISKAETSVTPARSPNTASTGVNTGASLLWPSLNMASTHSDTTPRGMIQAEGINVKSGKKGCQCCHHCHNRRTKNRRQSAPAPVRHDDIVSNSTSSHNGPSSRNENDPSLSDIQAEDINMFNETASSTRTLASSLHAVDIPVFDDSHEGSPEKRNSLYMDWNSSPMLGESASMIAEAGRKMVSNNTDEEQPSQIVEEHSEDLLVNNKEFYAQMMEQVQKLIIAQNITPQSETSNEPDVRLNTAEVVGPKTTEVVGPNTAEVVGPNTAEVIGFNTTDESMKETTEEDQQKRVRDVTLRQLQNIIKKSDTSPFSTEQRPRSLSAGVLSTYPKINYASMSVDETFNAHAQTEIDDIAAKYLPKEFKQVKTVKFEGVYENTWQTPSRGVNMRSINFSCNMSVASKRYLQKYELSNKEGSFVRPLGDTNAQTSRKQEKRNTDGSVAEYNKENILDFKKLQSLPKLL